MQRVSALRDWSRNAKGICGIYLSVHFPVLTEKKGKTSAGDEYIQNEFKPKNNLWLNVFAVTKTEKKKKRLNIAALVMALLNAKPVCSTDV